MEALLPEVSWRQLFITAVVIVLAYLLIQWLERRMRRFSSRKLGELLQRPARFLAVFFEPLAGIILLGAFFLINPLLHGLLLLLLLALSYGHLKNYLSGRMIQVGRDWQEGNQLEIGHINGVITRLGRLGIYLQDSEGQHYIGYSRLLTEGYTLFKDEDTGGFFNLKIQLPEEGTAVQHRVKLMDRLVKTPYLDLNHRPVIQAADETEMLAAKIFLREEKQLPELMQLIQEWGYGCQMNTKK